jgi:hypothetical protein
LSSAEREQARLKVTKKSRLAHNSLLTDSGLSFERTDEGDWQDKALRRDVAVLIA